jgi:hypothetical protein
MRKSMVEIVTLRRCLGLSPARGEIVKLLYEQEVVTTKEVTAIASNYKTVIHYLRNALKPYGIEIQSQQRLGYWMENDSKERIKVFVDGLLPGEGETAGVLPKTQPTTASENPVTGS